MAHSAIPGGDQGDQRDHQQKRPLRVSRLVDERRQVHEHADKRQGRDRRRARQARTIAAQHALAATQTATVAKRSKSWVSGAWKVR